MEEKKKESMEVNRHNSMGPSLLNEMPSDYSSLASSRIFDMIESKKGGSSSSSWFIDSSSLVQDLGSSTILNFLQQTSPPLAPLAQATSSSASALVETSEVLNLPATPNASSISSSSSEPSKVIDVVKEEEDEDEDQDKSSKKQSKTDKKKKWPRAPRFAFMTKSEVDHLDDSYRWRKYGQKAVKNSPFPRSYYRCTTAACGVKKRVERSCTDPTIVITTYEGQHTHPIPQTARGHLASYFTMPLQMTQTEHFNSQQQFPSNLASPSDFGSSIFTGIDHHQRHFQPSLSEYHRIPDHGLLEDIAPTDMRRE